MEIKYTKYQGWKIRCDVGNGALLPQEYRVQVYADLERKIIYRGDILSNNSWEQGNPDPHILTVRHPHPYYGRPDHYTYAELVAVANKAAAKTDEPSEPVIDARTSQKPDALKVKNVWTIGQTTLHYILEDMDGNLKRFRSAPFRALKESDLTPYKGPHPQMSTNNDPMCEVMYPFYGLSKVIGA